MLRSEHGQVAGRGLPAAAWALLLLAFALRLLLLDADPHYYAWTGHFTDEGRWVESARSLALDGNLGGYPKNLHLMLAPLFQLLNAPVLTIFGVSIGNARLLTAVFGSGILLIATLWLGRRVCRAALLIGLALLALQTDLLMLSRMAVPEIPAMAAETVIALLLMRGVRDRRMNVLAGIGVLVGVGIKSTMILIAAGFVLLPLLLPGEDRRLAGTGRPVGRRLADTLLYVLPFLLPLALAGGIALWRGLGPAGNEWYLPDFTSADGLWAVFAIVIDGVLASTLAPWALGAWLAVLSIWGVGADGATPDERRRVIGVALWLLATLLPALFLDYFPHRYQVHALVPLAFLAALGVDVHLRRGSGAIDAQLAGASGAGRLGTALLLALPTGLLAAPAVIPLLAALGSDPGRIRTKLLATGVATVSIAALTAGLGKRRPIAAFAVRLPVVAALVWIWLGMSSQNATFWAREGVSTPSPTWAALVAIATGLTAISFALARFSVSFGELQSRRGVEFVAAVWIVAGVVTVAPNYLTPHFTARDVSRDLGRLLAGAGSVTSHKAETLFNGNEVRYRSEYRIDPIRDRAEYFVTLKGDQLFHMFRTMLEEDYELVKTYRLYISPECEALYRARRGSAEGVRTVTVHRRKRSSRRAAGARPQESADAG